MTIFIVICWIIVAICWALVIYFSIQTARNNREVRRLQAETSAIYEEISRRNR